MKKNFKNHKLAIIIMTKIYRIGGGLFYILIDKNGETVGASGAIFGLLGAYVFNFL
jgi:membrane associated rhomboid family serine protease